MDEEVKEQYANCIKHKFNILRNVTYDLGNTHELIFVHPYLTPKSFHEELKWSK